MDYDSLMDSNTENYLNEYNFIDTSLSFEKIVKVIVIFSLQLLILSMQILINVNDGNEANLTAKNISQFYFQFLQNILINYGLTLIILIYFYNYFANTKFNLSKTARRALLKFYIAVYGIIFLFIDGLFLYNFYYVFFTQGSNATYKWATIHGFFVNIILMQLFMLWLILGIAFCIYKSIIAFFHILFNKKIQSDINES